MRLVLILFMILPAYLLGGCSDDDTNSAKPVAPRNGLVSEYLLNGNAHDSQGTNDGTLGGGPAFTTDRFGNANQAISFDGVDDIITTLQGTFVDSNNVSVSLWLSVPSLFDGPHFFLASGEFGVFTSGDSAGFVISTLPQGPGRAVGTFTVTAWHHLLGTYDGINISLYLDGTLVAATHQPGNLFKTGRTLMFGYYSQYWTGELDDVRIYNRTIRSAAEIHDLYHEGGYGL